MSLYFGDEPTCLRCDYPRRLHHLLGVDHEYEPPANENTPGSGQGSEGNENRTNSHEGTALSHFTATTTLAEQIGADWDHLDVTYRAILAEAHAVGIRLDLLQYFARNTVANRGDVAVVAR
ncbi:hypothetical protein FXW78_07085 [Rhodococcus opacus]|nr:hypothetical protein [Rhodococcus opacus]